MAQSEAHSPSPPPAPPVPLTPGPRAVGLQNLYSKTLTATLSSISYAHFSACFPTIAASNPQALRQMHENLVRRLEEHARAEFESILKEKQVVERLNALEGLVAEAERRRARGVEGAEVQVAPHTLPPKELLGAYLSSIHTSQQSLLNAKLQTVSSQNATLAQDIQVQRREIERLLSLGEGVVRDLEGAGGALQDGAGREVVERMRGAQKAVGGVEES